MSERRACRLLELARSTKHYQGRKWERDAARRMRFGYRRLTAMLMREGMGVNHKRVYRRLSRGRIGDADPAATADPLEWASPGAGSKSGERKVVNGFRQ